MQVTSCIYAMQNVEDSEFLLSFFVVAVGAGCKIACVKYEETIEISPDAVVGTYEKI